jgi:hypothetical protein
MSKKQFWKSNKNSVHSKTLEELRDEAASLISINNAITSQIWTIENQLLSCTKESKEALLKQKKALAGKLKKENYSAKINELKSEIYDLEIKEFGESDILKDSPSINNSFI